MHKKFHLLLLILFFHSVLSCSGISISDNLNDSDPVYDSLRIVFYNLENLFDIYDDSTTLDDEFLPYGTKHWTYSRYRKKLNHLFKTFTAIGKWGCPTIIGMCEVENRNVLTDLFMHTPLKKYSYQVIHQDSEDKRGIDVALVYLCNNIHPISTQYLKIIFPDDTSYRTRDILYVTFEIFETDTLHIFFNHWTSRYGGYMNTKSMREYQARFLRNVIDSLLAIHSASKIILMGDFNDEPSDKSLQILCNSNNHRKLINLFQNKRHLNFEGTIKSREHWQIFDQVIVSHALFHSRNKLILKSGSAGIFTGDFLFNKDRRYLGKKLFRTFLGYKYLGGFSDHLPVYIDLYYKEPP